jgi:general secretion pathway protein L
VDLPKVPKARLRAALDGLLEERLLDDTHAMAFALSPEAQAGKAAAGAWVAACDKAWLSNAIQAFDAAGYRVTQVVPEFWPQNEVQSGIRSGIGNDIQMLVSGTPDEAWLTRADAQGVVTVPLHVGETSGVLGSLLQDLPSDAAVFAEPAVVSMAEQALLRKVVLRPQAEGLLQSASSPWELAQFEQSLSGDSQGVKSLMRSWQGFWQSPAWRPARWGLAAVLLINIVGLNLWAWQQKASLSAKRSQINTVLTQTFPAVQVVVDAPLQMAREMAALRQSTGASAAQNLESMLSAFSTLNNASNNASNSASNNTSNNSIASINIAPTAIEYIADSVKFKGIKLPENELTAAQAKLKTAGYTLSQTGDTATLKVQVAR